MHEGEGLSAGDWESLLQPRTRRHVLKAGFGAAAAVAASPLLAACGSSSSSSGGGLDALRKNGAKVGIAAEPPESEISGGQAVGVFPEIAMMVCRKLGITKFTPVLTDFSGVIPGVQAGRVDLACPGLYITPERCSAILFTNPQVAYYEAMAVKAGNPHNIRTYKDVAKGGLRLGVVTGSFEPQLAAKEGVSSGKIQTFPDVPSMLDALNVGRIDAGGYDNVTIAYFLKKATYQGLSETEPYLPAGKNSAGIGLSKQAKDLQTAFNKEQSKLFAQNAFDPIYKKWGVPESSTKLAQSQTWQQFCKASA
ncbi:MAG TPA: transporter substrate-binding domain-containing protein [Solirubrobacteraceae bacterium]|jgi:polar amino acid transport system substrate-binding protein|nr:transporter substrate-binding domain-containing protein [Solirubrobacteraceae bacterium]